MKSIEYILLVLLIVFSVFLRTYGLENPIADWHSWRQSDTAAVSKIYERDGIDLLYPRYYDISSAQTGVDNPNGYRFVEFPFYNVIQVISYKAFEIINYNHSIDFVGRLVSILSSCVSLIFIYKIGKQYLNTIGGFIAAFFFATLPFNVFYSRTILPEPLALSLMLISLWFFVKYSLENKMSFLLISSISFAVSIVVKPFTIFYGLPMLYLAIRNTTSVISLIKDKKLWMFFLISLMPFLLWRLWIGQFPEGIPHMKWAFNGDGIRFRPAFWRWIFGERIGVLILGIGGVIPFGIGLLSEISRTTKNKAIAMMGVGMFLFVSVFATASVRHDYYQIIIVPTITLFLASGVVWLMSQTVFNKVASYGFVCFCIGLMYLVSWNEVKGYYQINNYSIVTAGEAVKRIVPQESKIIAPYNKDTAFLNQTERFGWPFLDGEIEELIDKGAEYYVSVSYDPDTIDIMKTYTVVDQTPEYVIVNLSK